ncbi:MAG: hypothetical protein V4669_20400 [Pseudomonadota bacterium]
MDHQFDTQGRSVPQAFQEAVTAFARHAGLDPTHLIEGNALEQNGIAFWLRHFGDDDTTGITIQMDIGEPPADPRSVVDMTTPLLQSHLCMPVGRFGYYGYLPHLNRIVHCTRIPLDEVEDAATSIAAAIATGAMFLAGARTASAGFDVLTAKDPS